MDEWGFEQLRPWTAERERLPVGPLLCVIDGPTRGRPWSAAGVRVEFRNLAAARPEQGLGAQFDGRSQIRAKREPIASAFVRTPAAANASLGSGTGQRATKSRLSAERPGPQRGRALAEIAIALPLLQTKRLRP